MRLLTDSVRRGVATAELDCPKAAPGALMEEHVCQIIIQILQFHITII